MACESKVLHCRLWEIRLNFPGICHAADSVFENNGQGSAEKSCRQIYTVIIRWFGRVEIVEMDGDMRFLWLADH